MSTFLFTRIKINDHLVIHEFAQGCFCQILGQHNNAKVQNLLHAHNNNYEILLSIMVIVEFTKSCSTIENRKLSY